MKLEQVDAVRREMSGVLDADTKAKLGQFLTPVPIARFMASLFPNGGQGAARLLDPGAGIGALASAFLDRWHSGGFTFSSVETVAFEIDPEIRSRLDGVLGAWAAKTGAVCQIIGGDFIEQAVNMVQFGKRGSFTHAILNPPYAKIKTNSTHRLLVRQVGIETVNLYTAFLALAIELVAKDGFVVAIVPRSFCNGPYYRPFRQFMLDRVAIRHIHLFGSRRTAFRDDAVLQENVILLLERGAHQGDVRITASTDDGFGDIDEREVPFEAVVLPGDQELFIHVDLSCVNCAQELKRATQDLKALRLGVSTGPVVDFRLKDHLRSIPEPGAVPLLYANHYKGRTVSWPLTNSKKPNAIVENMATFKWLMPNGFYTVVRRFSAKEERRRVVAYVHDPRDFPGARNIGFENHLNVFHRDKAGLPETLAHGLTTYLNSTAVDQWFRRFSGHTQVNATDLRSLSYPSESRLIALGEWAIDQKDITQSMIDEQIAGIA